MDFETYKNQLLEYVTRYKNWWCEPYEQFHKDNKKDYKDTFSMIGDLDNYHGLVNKFRASLQKQYDLPEDGLVNITVYDMLGNLIIMKKMNAYDLINQALLIS